MNSRGNRAAHNLVDEQQAVLLVKAPLAARAGNVLGQQRPARRWTSRAYPRGPSSAADESRCGSARTGRGRRSGECTCLRLRPCCESSRDRPPADGPTLACTPNSRIMRSTIISRCSSPMPEISVCPVSGSLCTLNVGSSCESLASALPSLSWSALVLGSMATEITGAGKFDRFQHDRLVLIAQRVARGHALQAHARGNVAGVNGVNFLALVGVHAQQAADALARILRRIENVAAGLQHAGIHPNVGHVADERVGHDLERQRRKRLIVAGPAQQRLLAVRRRRLPPAARPAAKADSPPPRPAAAARPCS